MEKELWREIIGYDGKYQVSNLGRVRNSKTGRVLKDCDNKNGYLRVGLCKDGTPKKYLVHRLVAEAFIENPFNKPYVDHIDTDTTNNRVENLRFVSHKENCNNELTREHLSKALKGKIVSEETRKRMSESRKGEKSPMYGKHRSEKTKRKIGEANSKQVEILKDGVPLGVFSSVTELVEQSEELFGEKLLSSSISAVCLGKYKQHNGFTFKYVN